MKAKHYTKIGVWLTGISLIVTFTALNPERAKRMACKIVVFLEIYSNVKECQYGCKEGKKKPVSKAKKSDKTEPKKKQSSKINPPNHFSGQLVSSILDLESIHLLFVGAVHLILLVAIKGIGYLLKTFWGKSSS